MDGGCIRTARAYFLLAIVSIGWKQLGLLTNAKLRFPHRVAVANRNIPVASAQSVFKYYLKSLFTF